jgi:serine/threonine protein kinase/sugar lactone lactonase YvrE
VSDEFPAAFSEFAIGSQMAGYRLEEQIGRGGMAVVYRAYDPRLERYVALKILAPGLALDDAFRQRFIRESRAAAAVDHPNIIPVFDAGDAGGALFIAMRFVQGGDVRTLLDAEGRLPAARAADITSQVASALDAAHARGLVHRDVKPANMLLDATAGGHRQDHVYLSDFGLSKQSLSQTGLTAQGQFLGTLDYVAPEQVEGRPVDGRADQYALACASFELLSGTPPFKRDGGLAVVWAKLSEDPPLLSPRREDLPTAIDDVMTRGMARTPDDRFGTCGEFAAALREVLGLRSPESGPRSIPPESRPPTEVATPPPTEVATPTVPPAAPSADPGAAAPVGASSAAGSAALTEPAWPGPSHDYRASADYATPPDYRAAQSGPAPARRVDGPRGAGTVVAPAPRPSWWRSRAAMATAAGVVVLGVAGGVFAALHHASSTSSTGGGGHGTSPLAAALTAPGCSTQAAPAHQLSGVRTNTTTLGGSPFGIAVTSDGKYSFVSLGNEIAVLKNNGGSLAPTQLTPVPASGAQKSLAITPDGQYLLAASGSGAYVISVPEAEAGDGGAVLGTLPGPSGNPSNEVLVSADGKLAFITFQNHGDVAVFNLQQAIGGGFGQAGFLGLVQLGTGSQPQGLAESPDGHWLYVTGESQQGRLYVVDMSKVATDPQHAVASSAAAGCAPARVIAKGDDVWVTDRDSNTLVAFSAAKLLSDPSHSIIARVSVGQTPIGLSFVDGGQDILVADTNTRGAPRPGNLALVSTQLALQGSGNALVGFLPSGTKPREVGMTPGGVLLVTENGSGQLQAIDAGSLP